MSFISTNIKIYLKHISPSHHNWEYFKTMLSIIWNFVIFVSLFRNLWMLFLLFGLLSGLNVLGKSYKTSHKPVLFRHIFLLTSFPSTCVSSSWLNVLNLWYFLFPGVFTPPTILRGVFSYNHILGFFPLTSVHF